MSLNHTDALYAAVRIGDHLSRTAYEHGGRCTWMGTTQDVDQDSDEYEFAYQTVGPELYGGTSGIALFLAEVHAHAPEPRIRRVAEGAIEQTLARLEKIPRLSRFGFYGGLVGVAYAAVRAGRLFGREDFVGRAREMLIGLRHDTAEASLLDVISGAAGAAPAILALAITLNDSQLTDFALELGERVMTTATKSELGWSWGESATGFETERHLTGFAHGAAGMGWSLLELYDASGDRRYLDGALEAFRYENHWFRRDHDNWPDFRLDDGTEEPVPFMVAWCHGAPGIGLSRLRALEIEGGARHREDLESAARAAARVLRSADPTVERDFSPCHGKAGVAEFLLLAADALDDNSVRDVAVGTVEAAVGRYGADPAAWPCGVLRGSSPSLMLGLAGIGYFLLRVADPKLESILLVRPRRKSAPEDPAVTLASGSPTA